jgi:hypothetical protein
LKKAVFIFGLFMLAAPYVLSQQSDFPELTGPYLGQEPPGELPEAFAPSIIFDENAIHGNIAFSPDGKEIYWVFHPPTYGQNPPPIQFIRLVNSQWTRPGILGFSEEYGVMNISMAPDGKKLFFTSKRPWPSSWGHQPAGNTLEAYKTWYVERSGAGWGDPKPLDPRINKNLMGVSATNDGTLYTHGIKRIKVKNGQYTEWEQLGPPLDVGRITGGNPFISPDETYILFNRKWSGRFGYGLFISYRTRDDKWTEPINLFEKINAPRGGSQPIVTPDGKYLFYYSGGKFCWLDAGIIEDLKPAARSNSDNTLTYESLKQRR